MFRMWTIPAVIAALVLTGGASVSATGSGAPAAPAEPTGRYEDPVGDATGSAPDIVAVTVSEPDDGPVVSFGIEFASEPPLGSDMEMWTDVLFVFLVTDPDTTLPDALVEVDDDVEADYVIGAHGATLPAYLETGGHLYASAGMSELYWHVVDVSADGRALTFTLDRKLIGDPSVLSWQVAAAVEREDATEEEYDTCPDEGEPRGIYTLTKKWR